jgi:tetratricopeptide (TPR) repeat protein
MWAKAHRLEDNRMKRSATGTIATCVFLACFAAAAAASDGIAQTGSRVDSGAARVAVMQMNESSTVDEIGRRLEQGKTRDAVDLARRYVESLNNQISVGEGEIAPDVYFALNALCIALTQDNNYDEAIGTCSRAVEMRPRRWSAINNRGTAHFAARQYEAALDDYRLALSVAPENADIRGTIAYNIELAESRLGEQP